MCWIQLTEGSCKTSAEAGAHPDVGYEMAFWWCCPLMLFICILDVPDSCAELINSPASRPPSANVWLLR